MGRRTPSLGLLLLAAVPLAGGPTPTDATPDGVVLQPIAENRPAPSVPRWVAGRIIVKYRESVSPAAIRTISPDHPGDVHLATAAPSRRPASLELLPAS